jgi:hypothetical protein
VIRHFQERMAEGLSVRDVHAEVAVAANRGDENPIPSARRNFNIPGRVCRDRPAQSIRTGIRSRFDIGRADSTWLRHRPRFCHSRDGTGQEEVARSQDQEEARSQDQEEVRSQELAQYKYYTGRMLRWLRW